MSSLFVLVEGQTEEAFVKTVLTPHLAERGVFSHAIVVTTSREVLFDKFFDKDVAEPTHARRKPWAWLLRHAFGVDVNGSPECAGPMKW